MIFKEKGKRKRKEAKAKHIRISIYHNQTVLQYHSFFYFYDRWKFLDKIRYPHAVSKIYKIIRLARIWPTYIARGEFCMLINMYLAFPFFFFFNFAFCYDNVIAIEYIYLCTNVL